MYFCIIKGLYIMECEELMMYSKWRKCEIVRRESLNTLNPFYINSGRNRVNGKKLKGIVLREKLFS